MPKPKYQWYHNVRRYRDLSGRFVAQKTITSHVDQSAASFAARIKTDTQAMIDNFTNERFIKWAQDTRQLIKEMHTAYTVIALGGKKAAIEFSTTNASVWADADAAIATQLRYWDQFIFGAVVGQVPFNGRFADRASMYAEAGFNTYQNGLRMREMVAGVDEERRIQNSSRPCSDCIVEAAQSWQPMGTLRRIGDSQCGARCRCYFEFRKRPSTTEPIE